MNLVREFLTLCAALGFVCAGTAYGRAASWLEYEAAFIQDESAVGGGTYALFVRYHVDADRIAGEILHYEPGWNHSDFIWRPLGLTIYSDASRLTMHNTLTEATIDTDKPVDDSELPSLGMYSPGSLAVSERDMLRRLDTFKSTQPLETSSGDSMEISLDDSGAVQSVECFLSPNERQSIARYKYDADSRLSEIDIESNPIDIFTGGVTRITASHGNITESPALTRYHEGGRFVSIKFEEIPLSTGTWNFPVFVEVRQRDTGRFLRSVRHEGFKMRSADQNQALPWQTWAGARLSWAERQRMQLLASHGYWLGQREPSPLHAAFYALFILPVDMIEEMHDGIGIRLRAFFHAYNAAMVLGNKDYLLKGFPWYMNQIASLESPQLLIRSGQECIRLLLRWGYDDIAEFAFPVWQDAVFALESEDSLDARGHYAREGLPYYAYRLFDPSHDIELSQAIQYRHQFWRCEVLNRLGRQINRHQMAVLGRADPAWAALTAVEWSDMVSEEFAKATELFIAIDEPTREEQRMQDALESFYIAAQEGRGFVESGGT